MAQIDGNLHYVENVDPVGWLYHLGMSKYCCRTSFVPDKEVSQVLE